MYHFTADHPPEPVRLSFRALIPGHIRQYLKDFQLDAIRFMHNFLAKGEFCVYNDESGLGKQAAVAVLLDAACSSKKCLIVVQNDDRYVNGWEFHFNVLTNTNVAVIKDEKDSTDSAHNIYIAKWSTLRTIDDLTKFKFDFIILDNRGQMLNNSFCTSMLLKHYERKISILISSVDITSDLKLLHNCLRLGGRLDPQYSSFKTFEEKFKLPDAKELAYKRVDLEEYFCKRERLADYCKVFRLRRYCHQFEKQLPLVKEDRYKINLELWREKQNATNSESSSIEYVNNNHNREDEHIKDTQELFEEYCRQRRKQHLQFQQEEEKRLKQREEEMLKSLQAENEIIYNIDDEVAVINETPPSIVTEKAPGARDNSDEAVLMSPLLVMSDSDADDEPEICHDPNNDIEIVDLSSEEREERQKKANETADRTKQVEDGNKSLENSKKLPKKKYKKKRTELDRLDENIVDTLKIIETPKRLTRHAKEEVVGSAKRLKDRLEEKRVEIVTSRRTTSNERSTKTTKDNNANNSSTSSTKTIIKTEPKTPTKSTTATSNKTPKNAEEKQKETSKDKSAIENNSLKVTKDNAKTTPTPTSTKTNTKSANKQRAETNETNQAAHTATTPLTSRKTRTGPNDKEKDKIANKSPTKTKDNHAVHIKQELLQETPQPKATSSKDTPQTKVANSERIRVKREMIITPGGIHNKETRSMQRLTRSAGGSSKYLKKNLALQIDKINKPKKKTNDKEITSKTVTNKNKKLAEDKTKDQERNTQASIISHRSSQDFESLQCAQRLSDAGVYDNGGGEKSAEFLVPPTPNVLTRNSLIPLSLNSSAGFFSESDVIFIPPSPISVSATANNRKREGVISLSSSENENSTSQSSSTNISTTSRRTRALKPKRNLQNTQSETTSKVPSFSELLAKQNSTRASAKSPDLFSNCSDLVQLPCTQPPPLESEEPNTPFEGFKIFGSEVKQLQQHYAFSKSNNNTNKTNASAKKSYREQRSCLDILEKMFEPPSNKKTKSTTTATSNEKSSSANNSPTKKSKRLNNTANKQKSQAPILPSHPIEAIAEARQQQELEKRKRNTSTSAALHEDEIFEITNNGTFGSVMRLHSNGEISPVQQTQRSNNKQSNKITNYLIGNATQNGSSGSQEETPTPNSGHSITAGAGSYNMEAGTPSKRHQQLAAVQNSNVKKSPKGKCNSTQATKLTKWFTKPSELTRSTSHQQQAAKAKSSNSKKTPNKSQVQTQTPSEEVDLTISSPPVAAAATGKRILKRRRLDLSFK